MLMPAILAVATGFFHVEQASDGRWNMIDPKGEETFLCGINTVNYSGPWCSALNTHPYKDENKKRFASEAEWAADAVGRMRNWGFNCLGAHSSTSTWTVCEIPHVKILLMGQKFSSLPGRDHSLSPYEGRPVSAFPNVWHPDFEKWCDDFAAANCAKEKDDSQLVGYYIDNELKWNGVAALRPDEKDFLQRTAERYFAVTTSAIRKADPNHMVMGCRFAGMSGAPKEVYAEAGKTCEIVSFNNYPRANIDRNLVTINTGYGGMPAAEAFREASAWSGGRPLIVSEWSFPALDSGLPCTRGAGCRFFTQEQRATASELYARTMMAAPQVVGYSYFKWTDQPALGVSNTFRENTNYGVNTIKGDIYRTLTDMFARVQPERMKWRHSPPPEIKPPPPPDPEETVVYFLSKSNATVAAGASVVYRLTNGVFRVENSAGMCIEGRIGGSKAIERIACGGKDFGSWNVMLCSLHEDGKKKQWTAAAKVASAEFRQSPAGGVLRVAVRNEKPEPAFEFVVDFHVFADRAAFVADVVSISNIGSRPFVGDRVFMRPVASFAPEANAIVPNLWRPLKHGGWKSKDDGRRYDAYTGSGLLEKMEFLVSKDGVGTPEMALRPMGDFTLAPGASRKFDGTIWGLFSFQVGTTGNVVETVGLKTHPRLVVIQLMDDTDHHDELYFEKEYLLSRCEKPFDVSAPAIFLEDAIGGDGVAFFRKAPLPHARTDKSPDWHVDPVRGRVSVLSNSYSHVKVEYSDGRRGRIRAATDFHRRFRSYVAGRDGLLLSNTWGDGNRDACINERFLMREVEAGAELGVDVIQIDDGWQKGRSANSAVLAKGEKGRWGSWWDVDGFWDVDTVRFPNGLKPVVEKAHSMGMKFGLWFGPDSSDDAANWKRDADFLLSLHRSLGIDYFKLDSMKSQTPLALSRQASLMDRLIGETGGRITIDLDVTAGVRPGYFAFPEIGPVFVENRYIRKGDKRLWWPHRTLRNFWSLSHVVDPVRLRMEVLNPERMPELYPDGDPLAPSRWPRDAIFAISMYSSPLGWFEIQNLSAQTMSAWKPLIARWKRERDAIHAGYVYPVGACPDGLSWTGFVSVSRDGSGGTALLFRELAPSASFSLDISGLLPSAKGGIEVIGGRGDASFDGGVLNVSVRDKLDFIWCKID